MATAAEGGTAEIRRTMNDQRSWSAGGLNVAKSAAGYGAGLVVEGGDGKGGIR